MSAIRPNSIPGSRRSLSMIVGIRFSLCETSSWAHPELDTRERKPVAAVLKGRA